MSAQGRGQLLPAKQSSGSIIYLKLKKAFGWRIEREFVLAELYGANRLNVRTGNLLAVKSQVSEQHFNEEYKLLSRKLETRGRSSIVFWHDSELKIR